MHYGLLPNTVLADMEKDKIIILLDNYIKHLNGRCSYYWEGRNKALYNAYYSQLMVMEDVKIHYLKGEVKR